jgi:nitroreductase
MDVTEALNNRHSVRAYLPDPISRDTLEEIFTAALRSPSWANTQPWEVYVAGGDILERIREAYAENFKNRVPREPDLAAPTEWPEAIEQRMSELRDARMRSLESQQATGATRESFVNLNALLFGAPVVTYLCMDRTLTPWSIYDLGLLSQSLMLAATERGIGCIPAYNLVAYPAILREKLDIPFELLIIMGIALGYEDVGDPNNEFRSTRRGIDDVVNFRGI